MSEVKIIQTWGSDLMVVNAARCSMGKQKDTMDDKDVKLIKYLAENQHVSCFEHCGVTFWMKIPIYVARQLMRHRSWCLSGDNMLWFKQPNGTARKMSIKEFHDKWHYGASPIKRGKSKINEMVRIPLKNRLEKMSIQSIDTYTSELTTTSVIDIWSNGQKEVYEIELDNGKKIKSTLNHSFFTNKGWKQLKEIINDLDLDCYISNVVRASNVNNNIDDIVVNIDNESWVKFYKDEDYEISSFGRVRTKKTTRGFCDEWNYKKIIKNNSNRMVFSYSKNGKTKVEQISTAVFKSFNKGNYSKNEFVCHKNDNFYDNRLSNLYVGNSKTNYNDSMINNKAPINRVGFNKIKNIDFVGFEEVYDLSVKSDEHNFICNGMVVHNCFNEISGRYVEFEEDFFTPEQFREQDENVKQGSKEANFSDDLKEEINNTYEMALEIGYKSYKMLLEQGVCKEQARGVLPLALNTQLYGSCNLRSFVHYMRLRLDSHAQKEIRDISDEMLRLVKETGLFKHSLDAFGLK